MTPVAQKVMDFSASPILWKVTEYLPDLCARLRSHVAIVYWYLSNSDTAPSFYCQQPRIYLDDYAEGKATGIIVLVFEENIDPENLINVLHKNETFIRAVK